LLSQYQGSIAGFVAGGDDNSDEDDAAVMMQQLINIACCRSCSRRFISDDVLFRAYYFFLLQYLEFYFVLSKTIVFVLFHQAHTILSDNAAHCSL